MKNLKYSILTFLLLGFISCTDDEKPQDQIVGTWSISSIVYTDCIDPDDNDATIYGEAGCDVTPTETYCYTLEMTFSQGGSLILQTQSTLNGMIDGSDTSGGSFSFSETNESEVTFCISGDCVTGTVSFSGSTMTWIGTEEDCTVTVTGSI